MPRPSGRGAITLKGNAKYLPDILYISLAQRLLFSAGIILETIVFS